MTTYPSAIDFYIDPLCPFAYQTALWIREVRRQNGLLVHWRFFSLEQVNRAADASSMWERDFAPGWTALRVAAFLRRRDAALCEAWYFACGKARHEDGRKFHEPEVARALLANIGAQPDDFDAALDDPTTHHDVRADHDEAVATLAAFGVPTIVFPDAPDGPRKAIFGPVVLPAPQGSAALDLWDVTVRYACTPGLYEIKTTRTQAWQDDIERVFTRR